MAKKKKRGGNRPRGHYCKVCGEHKANEKFSGKGHAAHICKKCAALPVAERNEMMALNKIEGMAFRHLSESEIKWLRGKMNDQRPEIAEAAREAHSIKFPHYERNLAKKGLTAFSLEFFIHGDVWDEYGDEVPVHMRFSMDRTGALRRVNYDAPEDERESEVQIGQHPAQKFLKAVVHQLNAPFWAEDLSDAAYKHDPYLDILPEYRPDYGLLGEDDWDEEDIDGTDDDEEEAPAEEREPLWSLLLELNNGTFPEITFYNQMHDGPQDLFWSLMDWFEPDEDELDFEEDAE